MSDVVVSSAATEQMEQENLEILLMLPFYPEPESPEQTSSLLRKLPRELRDKIWEWTARDLLRRGTHRRSRNNSLSAYLFLRESDSDRPKNGRHGYTPFRRFSLARACRQVRDEFMEALHRVVVFHIKLLDYRTANFLGPPCPFAVLDMRFLNDLILDIHLQHETFAVFTAAANKEKPHLPGPVSIKYTASGRLEDAQLVPSVSWLGHTPPPLVLSLAGMLGARNVRGFPHRYDKGFGLQFDRLMDALAWRGGRLSSLDLKLVLPPEIGAAPASTIDVEDGMLDFVSSLRRLRGVKRVVMQVCGYRLFSKAELQVEGAFRQTCQDAAVFMATSVLSRPWIRPQGGDWEDEDEEDEGDRGASRIFELESDGEEYEPY
ncbi:uncharacterized protein J3D65DRAFT_606078 [Phyllosticta citribraziliensis]|uniref:Uncharacterized protein n=1 Tax=Phyllosticta citribraziliensis TaxID=989973 RepID=A0ABR1LBS5_9PEZI